MTFVFTGNGNVSRGAQDIFSLLPHTMVDPADLGSLPVDPHRVYGCIVEEESLVERITDDEPFTRNEYYNHPERYRGAFHRDIAPHTSVLMNCGYWDARYPRVLTTEQIEELRATGNKKLLAVGDISCDVGGGVEFLTKSTHVEQPFFIYDVEKKETRDTIDGEGILMLGVDILPSELPKESSQFFGDKLLPFMDQLSSSDGSTPFAEQDDIPIELKGAVIAAQGELTPNFEYINKLREQVQRASTPVSIHEGSTVVLLEGHLFDSGLVNKVMDMVEEAEGMFYIAECEVRPNRIAPGGPAIDAGASNANKSSIALQISVAGGREALDALIVRINTLAELLPAADATVSELPFSYCSGDFAATSPYVSGKDAAGRGSRHGMNLTNSMSDPAMPAKPHGQARDPERVLVLGAGLVAKPLVEYLSRDAHRTVTIVSALAHEAEGLAAMRSNTLAQTMDLGSDAAKGALTEAVKNADVVVSLLPATLHLVVADACVSEKTPLVTASYVSPETQEM